MDQKTARKLFEEGGVFIFLDVPEGTEFGIDMKSWNTGERFRGVKMIPPGLHYIFYSSVGTSEDVAPRVGFFHNFKGTEVVVKRWDKLTEDVSKVPVSDSEIVGLKDNIMALDNFLGPYPYDIWEKWMSMSSNITDNLLNKLVPLTRQIRAALELQSCSDADRPRGTKVKEDEASCSSSKKSKLSGSTEEDLLPNLKPIAGTELRLTPLPEKSYPEGATPSEITQHSLDKTYTLETMILTYSTPSEILGEIEFCYICFLVGHSLEAFDHWKKLVTLFCCCESGVKKFRNLYDKFLVLLEIQIQEIPEEFLADIVSNNNFVYVNLRNLFRTISNSDVDGDLQSKANRFKNNLCELYQWDFGHLDSEDEDEAPVIVETE